MAFKNPYADKLSEFPNLAFHEEQAQALKSKWSEHFSKKKIIFEIGCSNATFLGDIAAANTDAAFVGMDWKFKILYKGAKRSHDLALKNIALIRGKAENMTRIFAAGELDEIWIFFPDPWAKKSQLKNRLIRDSFFAECSQVLKPGGRIHIKTDHPGYFQWMLAVLGAPQPVLPDYRAEVPAGEKGMHVKQMLVRKPMAAAELPPKGENAAGLFSIEKMSIDYWKEFPLAPGPRIFSNYVTLFEKGFIAQKLPVYYLSLCRR